MPPSLTAEEKLRLLNLQMLIARAAQKDSLDWWEDDALTPAGQYVLERLFLNAPQEAGRKLALEAARSRYQAAFRELPEAAHLFRLDPQKGAESNLQEFPVSKVDVSLSPIPSLDALRQLLLGEIGEEPGYEMIGQRVGHCLEIRPRKKIHPQDILPLAQTLAWAALEGKPGAPVFPYILDQP